MMLVLAGDIGGTNTRLALFEAAAGAAHLPLFERTYPSASYASLDAIAETFFSDARAASPTLAATMPERACFGIAGPVEGNVCRATNLPWTVNGRTLSQRLGVAH
ncbi:MAG: glucokinase, partial [Deltaproteobacteria bacterium]|nr:glucokinase [Deltaproteobacteria bacterium]